MKVGDRIRDGTVKAAWSGTILRIYRAGGDEIEEVDPAVDSFALVIHLDSGRFMASDLFRPGDVAPAVLH